jgi:hypothetical protein
MSVFLPDEIAGQPIACAGVGASKDDSNQARVAGEKRSSAEELTAP